MKLLDIGSSIPYPEFGMPLLQRREANGWRYVGWINDPPDCEKSVQQLLSEHMQSDHGEERDHDICPEGAILWMREPKATPPETAE